jgi:nitroimidazol reductase NimA-like FMN-containing flavoprotein (pyridoxamine 5'-phosphate oxidase superfamily)
MSESAAWTRLREAVVGRLAVVIDDAPDIFPINYVVDRGSVVFRTADGTKLAGSVGHSVAFEVDGYDADTGEAWSVVIKGTATEIGQVDEVLDALNLPLVMWHPSAKPRIIRIVPETISGRRFAARTWGAGRPTHKAPPE